MNVTIIGDKLLQSISTTDFQDPNFKIKLHVHPNLSLVEAVCNTDKYFPLESLESADVVFVCIESIGAATDMAANYEILIMYEQLCNFLCNSLPETCVFGIFIPTRPNLEKEVLDAFDYQLDTHSQIHENCPRDSKSTIFYAVQFDATHLVSKEAIKTEFINFIEQSLNNILSIQ